MKYSVSVYHAAQSVWARISENCTFSQKPEHHARYRVLAISMLIEHQFGGKQDRWDAFHDIGPGSRLRLEAASTFPLGWRLLGQRVWGRAGNDKCVLVGRA